MTKQQGGLVRIVPFFSGGTVLEDCVEVLDEVEDFLESVMTCVLVFCAVFGDDSEVVDTVRVVIGTNDREEKLVEVDKVETDPFVEVTFEKLTARASGNE